MNAVAEEEIVESVQRPEAELAKRQETNPVQRRRPDPDVLATHVDDHLATAGAMHRLLPELGLVAERLCEAFGRGGRLYTFGNGGSAADAQHLAGEMVGRYERDRRPLPAVAMTVDPSVVTCIGNDYDYAEVFARQVHALAEPGDMVIGFTTSGRSANVVRGLAAARERGAVSVLFGSEIGDGGPAREHADHALLAPSKSTPRIQEMHLLLLHLLSEYVDRWVTS